MLGLELDPADLVRGFPAPGWRASPGTDTA